MRPTALTALALCACKFGFAPTTDGGASGDGGDGGSDVAADVATLGPPSCVGLPQTCGPMGNASCCDSPLVPGGMFYRSYDGVGFNDMGFPATLGSFRLDAYEVTVGRFRKFVDAGAPSPEAGAGRHAAVSGSGWDASWNAMLPANTAALMTVLNCDSTIHSWTDTVGARESMPIGCVSWYVAMAFCIWDGGYLPSEAEWNFAAAGGQQRAYPWSSPPMSLTIAQTNANFDCLGDGVAGCAVTDYLRVGSLPGGVGAFGQFDLSGNTWEWVLDYYTATYPMPCVDCVQLVAGPDRGMRGGSFYNSPSTLRQGQRINEVPDIVQGNNGVRCARPP